MDNSQKALLYEDYVRHGQQLENENNKLRNEHPINTPIDIKKKIEENQRKIDALMVKIQNLH